VNTYFTLQKLSSPTASDLGKTFARAAALIGKTKEEATIQFRLLGEAENCWTISLSAKGAKAAANKPVKNPDFELITRAETWAKIADGTLAPLRAFTQGKMRVRGDIEFGEEILKRLAKSHAVDEKGE